MFEYKNKNKNKLVKERKKERNSDSKRNVHGKRQFLNECSVCIREYNNEL